MCGTSAGTGSFRKAEPTSIRTVLGRDDPSVTRLIHTSRSPNERPTAVRRARRPLVQVARSAYESPTTDTSFRKVVQYISYPSQDDAYGYDYAAGHGTHVAGTVVGSVARDGDYDDALAQLEECGNYYDMSVDDSSCADYSSSCSNMFCATCTYAGYCDEVARAAPP